MHRSLPLPPSHRERSGWKFAWVLYSKKLFPGTHFWSFEGTREDPSYMWDTTENVESAYMFRRKDIQENPSTNTRPCWFVYRDKQAEVTEAVNAR